MQGRRPRGGRLEGTVERGKRGRARKRKKGKEKVEQEKEKEGGKVRYLHPNEEAVEGHRKRKERIGGR